MDEMDNIIILNAEDGHEEKFEFLDLVELRGKEYVVLLPTDVEDGEGEVVILQVEHVEDDEESYVSVEDEVVLMEVFELFRNKYKDEYDFID